MSSAGRVSKNGQPKEYLRFALILLHKYDSYDIFTKRENMSIAASMKAFTEDFCKPDMDVPMEDYLSVDEIEESKKHEIEFFKSTYVERRSKVTLGKWKSKINEYIELIDSKTHGSPSYQQIKSIIAKKHPLLHISLMLLFNHVKKVKKQAPKKPNTMLISDIIDEVEIESSEDELENQGISESAFNEEVENSRKKQRRENPINSLALTVSPLKNSPVNDSQAVDPKEKMFLEFYRTVMSSQDEVNKQVVSQLMKERLEKLFGNSTQ